MKPFKFLAYRTNLLMKLLNKSLKVNTVSANSKRRTWLLPAITALLSVMLASTAIAQDDKDDGSKRKTKETVAMSQQVYESLMEIQEFVEADDFPPALEKIKELQTGKKKMSPYETAQIWNLQAYTYYLMEDYPKSIGAYEKVLQQPELPEALQQSTLKTLAQLHFTVEDYDKALETINRLMAAIAEPSADIYMLKGQAYFQMGQYEKALGPIKIAIDMNREPGQGSQGKLVIVATCHLLGDERLPEYVDCYSGVDPGISQRHLRPDTGRCLQ